MSTYPHGYPHLGISYVSADAERHLRREVERDGRPREIVCTGPALAPLYSVRLVGDK